MTVKILDRWFETPRSLLDVLAAEYAVDQETPAPPEWLTFTREGATWRVEATSGNLVEARRIEVFVTVPDDVTTIAGVDTTNRRWTDELGKVFHAELVDMFTDSPTIVRCDECDEYPMAALDDDEAQVFADRHNERTDHTATIGSPSPP